jgi:hypothetical protein
MWRTRTRRWRTFRERDSITPFIWKRRQPEIRRWWSYRGLRSGGRLRGASKAGDSVDLRSRGPQKVPFIEISPFRDNGMLSDWVIELPTFVASRIPNEYTFFVVGLKRIALISLDMHIGSAPPYLEVGNIGFSLIEHFEGCRTRERSCRQLIPDMDHRWDAFTPERGRKSRLWEHGSDSFTHSPISSFRETVLLRPVVSRMPSLDASSLREW